MTGGSGTTTHDGWFPAAKSLLLTDRRGREYRLTGRARTSFPLHAWPDIVFFNALTVWTDQDGNAAVGEAMDFYTVCDLTDQQPKRGMGPW